MYSQEEYIILTKYQKCNLSGDRDFEIYDLKNIYIYKKKITCRFDLFSGFLVFASLTTFHFFCAMCDGPGYLPLEWRPVRFYAAE